MDTVAVCRILHFAPGLIRVEAHRASCVGAGKGGPVTPEQVGRGIGCAIHDIHLRPVPRISRVQTPPNDVATAFGSLSSRPDATPLP